MLGKKPVILHDSGHRRIAVTRKIRMKPASEISSGTRSPNCFR